MGGFKSEEQPVAAGPDDGSLMITKGKRTKRPRTPSPCSGGTNATSSSLIGGGGGGGVYDVSPSSSSGTTLFQSTEEEEEDMAHCLILLAQGPGRRRDEEVAAGMESGESSRSNKKFSEVASNSGSAAAKAGFYVYECKTCTRTFPSFQALGGHRASHKRPRASETAKKFPSDPISNEDEEVGQFRKISISPSVSSTPSCPSKLLQASKAKIHECSVCGLEFSSGQALGGHMRRHRAAAAPSTVSDLVTMSIDSVITDNRIEEHSPQGAVLSLDLNLPAPEDNPKFQFKAAPAQKPLLFSGPALVDCHY